MSDPDDYRIGIVCALAIEHTAIQLILDEIHAPPLRIHQPDPNNYTLGRIGKHKVVITVLPDGEYGTVTAATISTHMIHSFPNVKTGLMVGIGGGAPDKADIRLGDVVVSSPKDGGSGVLQYDFGKTIQKEELRLTRYLDQAPYVLRNAAAGLRSKLQQGLQLVDKIEEVASKCELSGFTRPAIDRLYRHDVIHVGEDCSSCGTSGLVERPPRPHNGPMVHYGLIASADFLMKNAELRNQLAQKHGILCFEMEAAGLVNHFPCLIIRGICDYSDTHKNKDWQGYAALAAAIYAKELLNMIDPSQFEDVQTIKDFSIPFGLPGAPILETFSGRANDLLKLEEALPDTVKDRKSSENYGSPSLGLRRSSYVSNNSESDYYRKSSTSSERNDMRRTIVVCGLGGMGKTQLVIEYAKRHSKDYTAILWLNGKDEGSLENSFVTSLKRLKVAHPRAFPISIEQIEAKVAVDIVLRWLNTTYNSHWLLIFDNVDEPDISGVIDGLYDIRKYFPSSLHGHIIITTRCMLLRIGEQLVIQKMENGEECLDILRSTSMRPNIDKESKINELLQRLDGLPLALSAAGSYLSQMPDSVEEYLRLYHTSWLELQEDTAGLPEHEGRTLNVTWQITADRVRTKDPLAWRLLELWAFFANSDLWYELVSAGQEQAPQWFQEIVKTKSSFGRHMRSLRTYGLIEVHREPARFGIHSCLHDWLKAVLPDTQRQELRDLALICITRSVPGATLKIGPTYEEWPLQRRLLIHADEHLPYMAYQTQNVSLHEFLRRFGNLYYNTDRAVEAVDIYKQILQHSETILGADHIDTLHVAFLLSRACCSLYQLSEAETICNRILSAKARYPNLDNLLYLRTTVVLGKVYSSGTRFTEAENIFLSVQKAAVDQPGWNIADEANLLAFLGNIYIFQSRFTDAKTNLRQALSMMRTPDSPQDSEYNGYREFLGLAHVETGDLDEAEQIYSQLYEYRRAKLGDYNRATINVGNMLGDLYTKIGHFERADSLLTRTYNDCKATYGTDDYYTLAVGDSLGANHIKRGELTKAEILVADILVICDRTVGPDHVGTMAVVQTLGDVYRAQEKLSEAKDLYERAYHGFAEKLGIEHNYTKKASSCLDQVTKSLTEHEDAYKSLGDPLSLKQEILAEPTEHGVVEVQTY